MSYFAIISLQTTLKVPLRDHFTRQGLFAMLPTKKKGVFPVRLPDTPLTQGPIPLLQAPIQSRVCEFVEVYENYLSRTLTQGTHLVRRWVLDNDHLFAALLPLCPSQDTAEELPGNEIDCVASVFEVPSSFWARGCYVLRVRAASDHLSFELYASAVPTGHGTLPMQYWNMWYTLSSLGTTPEAQKARDEGSPLHQALEQAQLRAERYQTFVMKALEAALTFVPQGAKTGQTSHNQSPSRGFTPANSSASVLPQEAPTAGRRRRD